MIAKKFKVLITETGEALEHNDLNYILDVIVKHHNIPVQDLLDKICIVEITDLDGYSGSTLPIRKQVEWIENYMRGK